MPQLYDLTDKELKNYLDNKKKVKPLVKVGEVEYYDSSMFNTVMDYVKPEGKDSYPEFNEDNNLVSSSPKRIFVNKNIFFETLFFKDEEKDELIFINDIGFIFEWRNNYFGNTTVKGFRGKLNEKGEIETIEPTVLLVKEVQEKFKDTVVDIELWTKLRDVEASYAEDSNSQFKFNMKK